MVNQKVLPKGVNLIGTCPYCVESVEFPISREKAKEIRKGFKGKITAELGIGGECFRCGKHVEMMLDKKQVKELWEGMNTPIPNNTTRIVKS